MTSEPDVKQVSPASVNRFSCRQCAAELAYRPGTTILRCDYCGAENAIETPEGELGVIAELDYAEHLAKLQAEAPTHDVSIVKCSACGAEVDRPPNLDAFPCPFCRADMLTGSAAQRLLAPRSILPFAINRERAHTIFRAWIGKRWFAPSDLKRFARSGGRVDGVYIPFWTYDSNTISDYTGQRGDDYFVTESYTTTENGKSVTKRRQVRKTRWSPAAGRVHVPFDDVLVCASRSLPDEQLDRLEPWDLGDLAPFRQEYLAGFRAEKYQVGLEEGFAVAREIMDGPIRSAIRSDIGGDHQRIAELHTQHSDVTFKHMLMPVWVSAYRYRGKIYQFLINARTGELQGERPWSMWKIMAVVLAGVAAVGVIAVIVALSQ